jgi:hypothetical protein
MQFSFCIGSGFWNVVLLVHAVAMSIESFETVLQWLLISTPDEFIGCVFDGRRKNTRIYLEAAQFRLKMLIESERDDKT